MVRYYMSTNGLCLYNLKSDEVERYEVKGNQLFRIETDEASLTECLSVQEGELVEVELSEAIDYAKDSPQMSVLRARIMSDAKKLAGERINNAYPLYKQININSLQGYTEADRSTMWQFINDTREKSNILESRLLDAITTKELCNIEMEVKNGNY